MQIKETLGVSKESVFNKEYNLWIGLSFGNKWFTKENTEQLIKFALEYTKESLLILVPGRLFTTNLRYFDGLSRANALKKAFEAEDQKMEEVEEIVSRLSQENRNKITITNYDGILTPQTIKQREILMREFAEQGEFYNLVMEIANEISELRGRTTSKDRSESVALYVLQELPLFLNGVSKIETKIIYTVVLYPGLGKLDDLVTKIINDKNFIKLKDKLGLKNETGIASVE